MAEGAKDTEAEAAARAELLKIAEEVEAIGRRLKAIHVGLPIPPNEDLMLLGENEMDISTEMRSVIECVLADNIGPAARDLRTAAVYEPSPKGPKGEQAP